MHQSCSFMDIPSEKVAALLAVYHELVASVLECKCILSAWCLGQNSSVIVYMYNNADFSKEFCRWDGWSFREKALKLQVCLSYSSLACVHLLLQWYMYVYLPGATKTLLLTSSHTYTSIAKPCAASAVQIVRGRNALQTKGLVGRHQSGHSPVRRGAMLCGDQPVDDWQLFAIVRWCWGISVRKMPPPTIPVNTVQDSKLSRWRCMVLLKLAVPGSLLTFRRVVAHGNKLIHALQEGLATSKFWQWRTCLISRPRLWDRGHKRDKKCHPNGPAWNGVFAKRSFCFVVQTQIRTTRKPALNFSFQMKRPRPMSEGAEKLAAAGPRIALRNVDWTLSKKFDWMALCAWEHKLCLCLTGKRHPIQQIVPVPLHGGDYTTARFSDWNHQLQSLLHDLHRKPPTRTNEVEEG